jgi:hypothetical protein
MITYAASPVRRGESVCCWRKAEHVRAWRGELTFVADQTTSMEMRVLASHRTAKGARVSYERVVGAPERCRPWMMQGRHT